jgi:hypothetical protein
MYANINVLDGSVNVNSGSNGSYTIVYEICQIDNITIAQQQQLMVIYLCNSGY